ncbi:hypothetical protein DEU56DRAFT_504518 [Suillus clintonianus]|uniref:uncharacterized protein n=1 Tax=Suillus clintonianus TaxID=1904413 RepID=UPI001B882A2E|nr:uncharacterized protein DEU56DRAFT_504518 [Suillus clintonianus]KAG2128699.1 hypothetical protein DEU56DRAFT_504518 [Suillus clintonianus]
MQIQKIDSAGIPEIIAALQSDLVSISHGGQTPDFETAYSPLGAGCNPSVNLDELEVRAIKAIIVERQQQLDAVRLKASNLGLFKESALVRKLRWRLLDQEAKITESQNTHRRIISALWRFPTEILSLIFVYCLPKNKFLSPRPQTAPLLLTRVCRRWRMVAVDMPSLWCGLSVGKERRLSAFSYESWLKRSRGCPLSLALHCRNNNDWAESRNLIHPYINQVSSLALHTDYNVSLPVISDFLALERLAVYRSPCSMQDLVRSISQSPSTLRSLNIPYPQFELESLSAFEPALWAHLTNVQITVDQLNTICHLLHLCPDLSSLSVDISNNSKQILEPFTHTKLQSLQVFFTGFKYGAIRPIPCGIFNAVTLPDLRVLKARAMRAWPHENFKAFLIRSNCPLKSLTLGYEVETTEEQRAEYIALIPSLVVERYP